MKLVKPGKEYIDEIRAYRQEDSTQIAELYYNTVHSINATDYSDEQLDAWATKDQDDLWWQTRLADLNAIVAEQNGIIVGFGGMDEAGCFDLLYVHKDHQRVGVATRIADSLEQYAFNKGIRTVTTYASITARPFFDKRGYVALEKQEVERNGQRLVNFKMSKEQSNRKATLDDLHVVTALGLLVYSGDNTYESLSAENHSLLRNQESVTILAFWGETAIGMAQASIRHDYVEGTDSGDADSKVGYLEGVFVKSEYRLQGIAKDLVIECEQWAKSMGCAEFASDCKLENEESRRFHLKIGFSEVSRNIHFAKKLYDN